MESHAEVQLNAIEKTRRGRIKGNVAMSLFPSGGLIGGGNR